MRLLIRSGMDIDPGLLAGLTKTVYGDGLLLAADYMHAIILNPGIW